MARDLTTGWKRIGRSGPAVDGREIKPEMIEQAAANYNKDLFTALIWPEHFRYINLGTVEELRAADNEEGGKDLFAKISPNQFYLQANSAGQKLFTSMELTPDFRKTGQWYLTGLGATDDPASAATTEMRLSASAKPGVFLAKAVEHADHTFNDSTKPSFFEKIAAALFSNPTFEEEAMASQADMEKFKNDLLSAIDQKIEQKFAALKPGEEADKKPDDKKPETADAEKFAAMVGMAVEKAVEKVVEKFAKKDDQADGKAPETEKDDKKPDADKFAAIEADLKALQEKFNAALKEQPGTQSGEHFGAGENLDEYL